MGRCGGSGTTGPQPTSPLDAQTTRLRRAVVQGAGEGFLRRDFTISSTDRILGLAAVRLMGDGGSHGAE